MVSRSSTEAEYQSMASITCELQCLTNILQEFPISLIQPALLYYDNSSTRHIVSNSSFHEHTKHINLDFHLVREKLQLGLFQLLPYFSSQQVANLFTKPMELQFFNLNQLKFGEQS